MSERRKVFSLLSVLLLLFDESLSSLHSSVISSKVTSLRSFRDVRLRHCSLLHNSSLRSDVSSSHSQWIVLVKLPVTKTVKKQVNSILFPYKLGKYIPNGGFMTIAPSRYIERLRASPYVFNVLSYDSKHRINPFLEEELKEIDVSEKEIVSFHVMLSEDPLRDEKTSKKHQNLWKSFAGNSIQLEIESISSHSLVIHLKNSAFQNSDSQQFKTEILRFINVLSTKNEVNWIELRKPYKLLNNHLKPLIQSVKGDSTPIYSKGLNGEGQIIGTGDVGISYNMPFFEDADQEIVPNTLNTAHRKIILYQYSMKHYAAFAGDEYNGHGTHTAGTLAGDASGKLGQFNGVAPKAKLAVIDIGNEKHLKIPSDVENDFFGVVYRANARIMSNSWGGDGLFYSYECHVTDKYVHQHRDFLLVFAGGNSGNEKKYDGKYTIAIPSNAKNVVSVGSARNSAESFKYNAAVVGIKFRFTDDTSSDVQVVKADFSAPLRDFSVEVVYGSPGLGCDALTNAAGVSGKAVILERGECFFTVKTSNAEAAGAVLLIVVNSDDSTFVMGSGDREFVASIPVVMISKSSGEILREKTLSSVSGPVNMDGNFQPGVVSTFSSAGPTSDGRIKPDVLGIGEVVFSAKSDGNLYSNRDCSDYRNCLVGMSGTSMATPVVAGAAALIRQYFMEGFYPTGKRTESDVLVPSASLLKAVLINSGVPVAGNKEQTGFGQIVLETVLMFPESKHKLFVMNEEISLETFGSHKMCLFLKESHSVKATLPYTDPPGHYASFFALVNNLNLGMISMTTGRVFYGNNLSYVDDKGDVRYEWDMQNNVEQIELRAAATEYYALYVHGTNVPEGAQDFSLVLSGEFEIADQSNCRAYNCPNDCSGNGKCSAELLCICDSAHTGVDCAVESALESLPFSTVDTLRTGAWEFYHIVVSKEDKNAHTTLVCELLTLSDTAEDPDLYVSLDRFPTIADFDAALLVAGSSNITTLEIPLQEGTYYFAVNIYCCGDVKYQLDIHF